jgi:hypothetical protein
MARFADVVGFAEADSQTAPGVWSHTIAERTYYGDVIRNSVLIQAQQAVNDDLSVGNSISIVADPYANERFSAIRYVRWMGTLWMVTAVEVQSPRLILRLGGVYNGPKAA